MGFAWGLLPIYQLQFSIFLPLQLSHRRVIPNQVPCHGRFFGTASMGSCISSRKCPSQRSTIAMAYQQAPARNDPALPSSDSQLFGVTALRTFVFPHNTSARAARSRNTSLGLARRWWKRSANWRKCGSRHIMGTSMGHFRGVKGFSSPS